MGLTFQVNRTLLYQEVVNALYQLIDDQKMCPGDQLPPERELIEQLGVSRNVLREAFHVLEQRGIIISRQGKGRFLREIPKCNESADKYGRLSINLERYSIYEAYEVRQALEVKAMELIVKNASDKDLQDIEEAYQDMLRRFEVNQDTAGEFEMHRIYAQKSGSVFMEQMMDIVLQAHLEMMNTNLIEVRNWHDTETEKKEHWTIVDALRRRDQQAAQQAMFEHIQTSLEYFRAN